MFLISHTIGPVLGNTVPLALFAFDPTPGWDVAVLAAGVSLFWLFPFLLRRGVAYERLVLLSVVNLNFCILWSCYHYGGVASPTLTWVLIIPILSLFYMGGDRRLHPHLLAIAALSFAVFYVAYTAFHPGKNDMPAAAMLGLGAVSTVATLCYVATMAVYYARIFDAGVDLETEVRRRRAMADELRAAVVAAHRTASAKTEFLARMSHEIRTPLNAIVGYGQILQEEAADSGDPALQQDVQRIVDAAEYLIRLINMILDLAKIEAGRMCFDVHAHSVADMIDKAVQGRAGLIEENGNRVMKVIAPGLDTVEVDGNRFLQILDGVLENAAQHTRGGSIAIAATARVTAGGPVFTVVVSDTGPGMPEEVLESLFQTFATSRSAADGRYGGTGLNMAVCSRLCRAMGGSIGVESRVGEGTTFTITLPIAPESADESSPAPQELPRAAVA